MRRDRLQAAQVKGIFHEETGGQPGYASGDLLGKKSVNFTQDPGTVVGLDYGSSSIGLDFGRQVAAVDTIHLKKDQPGSTYRVNKKALEVLYSQDNTTYTKVADSTWKFTDDGKGNYTLTLDEPINAQVVKVHNRYDDRDEDLGFTDKAQFKNTLEKAISAEQKLNEATLGYVYDEVGNRIEERFTRATTQTTLYTYYLNSNRLLTNGKYAFVYDANGNLVKKGNTYTIGAGQQVTFTTTGEGVEYWEYGYDLRNQLVQVTKNGQVVGSYSYDGEGLRVAGTSAGVSRHYIFDPGGRVIYETRAGGGSTNPTSPPDTSYVFAFGQHLAKVAGTIGGGGEISYYHNDQLGSPMAMTDKTGRVIWSQDYLPYGLDLNENAQGGDTRFKFTGKEQDEATGLYYFNARWYDPDLGRFVTEDSYAGDPNIPLTLNKYVYALANPLVYFDKDGRAAAKIFNDDRRIVVVIDPGHGGMDPGALARYGGQNEADINLEVGREVKKELEERGYIVYMTRDTKADVPNYDNSELSPNAIPKEKEAANLRDRVALAEQVGAKAFLSIHADATDKPQISGFHTYYTPDYRQKQSEQLAKLVADALDKQTDMPPGTKEVVRKANFLVTRETTMPATLVELGRMTNKEDALRLNSKKFKKEAGEAIADAVDKHYKSNNNAEDHEKDKKDDEQTSRSSGPSRKYSAI